MNRNDNDRNRPSRRYAPDDLRAYTGVQRGAYGRYDEDDWLPREVRSEAVWDYGDQGAGRGPDPGPRGRPLQVDTEIRHGDFRNHYGSDRGHGHASGYYGHGVDDPAILSVPSASAPSVYDGYAERMGGDRGSGAYGHPRGRPGEDFRGRGPKNYVRSDERVREDIAERLTFDPQIDAGDIVIDVRDGLVVLTGSVDRRQTRYRVEDLVSSCPGVREVDNRLGIAPAQTQDSGDATNRTPPRQR